MKHWFSGLPTMWWVKMAVIFIFLVFAVLFTVPTFLGSPKTWPAWAKSIFPETQVSLGLDLRGGLALTLDVDVEDTANNSISRAVNRAREIMAERGVKASAASVTKENIVTLTLEDKSKVKEFVKSVGEQTFLVAFDKEDNGTLTFRPNFERIEELQNDILTQAINTLRNRIDQFGVVEPSIVRLGTHRISVQMPGVQDPQRAKELIGNTAQLDFRLVLRDVTEEQLVAFIKEARAALHVAEEDTKPETIAQLSQWLRDQKKIPTTSTVLLERTFASVDGMQKLVQSVPLLVEALPKVTGEMLENAFAQPSTQDVFPEYFVSLSFKPHGAKLFGELTSAAYEAKSSTNRIAIVLDQNVQSAPTVSQPILNGQAQITLGRGRDLMKQAQEARDLALVLKAGALPAKVSIVEERQVGPSEGEDNIRKGIVSSLLAAGIVVVFMIYVYGNSGIVANIAMIFNVLCILAFLAAFGATLTLPGIAGIVLTMAVAVDGNVIINERIREEIRKGLTAKQAFYKGYNSSFATLLDAHVTSAVAGVVLLIYGNPAVKGFAITLLVGIISTLFTSYYVTEVIGQFLIEKTKIKRFS